MDGSRQMTATAETRLASAGVWEEALSLLGDCSELRVLDAPAGSGLLSDLLSERGGKVISLDIDPGKQGRADWVRADLNAPLPFGRAQFDRVVSVEGIEHLENPSLVLREFARILKPDGVLILTTPNVVNIRSRIKFLLTGNLFWFDEYAVERFGHIAPQLPFLLKAFVERAGFEVAEISTNRLVGWMRALMLPVRLAGAIWGSSNNDRFLLAGEILVLRLQKTPRTHRSADP